jgi:hypothetical protein
MDFKRFRANLKKDITGLKKVKVVIRADLALNYLTHVIGKVAEVISFLGTAVQQLNGVNIPINAAENVI